MRNLKRGCMLVTLVWVHIVMLWLFFHLLYQDGLPENSFSFQVSTWYTARDGSIFVQLTLPPSLHACISLRTGQRACSSLGIGLFCW